jgi:DNA polymerase-4
VRHEASILHLDLDAFFASVEQRDKPSLRGKPVVVGGVGARGVVATASYEARLFGVHSAMPGHEAKRRCPHAAFLGVRFPAYRAASRKVMAVLRDLSPRIEPLSLDEAFVDLADSPHRLDLSMIGLESIVGELKAQVAEVTGGLTASVGVGTSKFIAKVASEINKPDGSFIVQPGTEVQLLRPMSVKVLPGVGPVTLDKLRRIGVSTVDDLQRISLDELVQVVGRAHGQGLVDLAHARDDRTVEPEREAKSISVEDTFETDLVDIRRLTEILDRHAAQVAGRLRAAELFARTVTIKVRQHDFVTQTRARTLMGATDRPDLIGQVARGLLSGVDTSNGVRLLGVGVAGLTDVLQEDLFADDDLTGAEDEVIQTRTEEPDQSPLLARSWPPGIDVVHDLYGPGWVWGSGVGRVTVRFETRDTPSGPIRTFSDDDPALQLRPVAEWADDAD